MRLKKILIKQWLFIFIFLLFLSNFIHAADFRVEASIDRSQVAVNQGFVITLEVTGEGTTQVNFQPEFPASMDKFCQLIRRGGESSNFQIINNQVSFSKSIQYTFQAKEIGKFQIDPIVVNIGNETYQSNSFQIEIVKAGSSTSTPPTGTTPVTPGSEPTTAGLDENLFLKATVNKRTVYQNEPVIVTYKIYTRVTVTSYNLEKLPNTTGFWQEEFEMPQQPRLFTEVINGRKYQVAEIRKVALFPTETGKKTLEPLALNCEVRVQTRRRPTSIFDSFFDDPFFGRTQSVKIANEPITINVLPLPLENKPKDFSGIVGRFNLTVTADKNEVEANEAIKLKARLSGEGNIRLLPNPVIELPEDFEKYGPTTSEKINRENSRISGSKSFEYVLIPRQAGNRTIKGISLAYFDLDSKSYKILQTPDIQINIKKGKKDFVSMGPGFSREEIKILGKDIRYIQQTTPEFSMIGKYFYQSPAFLILLFSPLLILAGAIYYRRRLDVFSENVAYARSRRASRIATDRLKAARKFLAENTQKEFYAEVSKAILSFVANKLNLDEAGIMSGEVQNQLRLKNVSEATIQQYQNCLQTCDFQRFAPSNANFDEMKNFYNEAKNVITNLQKVL
ncbi:protein BatD [candidate division KSB1 bacterium]|nr:protein BatD [candidate division KSB1 bacterium]